MFSAAIIVFRETLEAALIISIVAVATLGLRHRSRWIGLGVASGVLGAMIVASLADRISGLGDGMGQELFNAGVLGLAVLMLAWHNIWMSRHGMQMASEARQLGSDVREGSRHMSSLALVIALAVLREGAETALFLYSLIVGETGQAGEVAAGGALGLALGAAVGWGLYAGFVHIPVRWFFKVTSVLVLLLSGAMASNMARYLVAADVLPSLADPLWDTSAILDSGSGIGMVLHMLMGYEAQPLGIQLVFYVATIGATLIAMRLTRLPARTAARPLQTAVASN